MPLIIEIHQSTLTKLDKAIKNPYNAFIEHFKTLCQRENLIQSSKSLDVLSKKDLISLTKHIEHEIPYSFCQKHKKHNLVVFCSLCNVFKSDLVFEDDEHTKDYLSKK